MRGKSGIFGIVALCTLIGGVLAPQFLAAVTLNPEIGRRGARQEIWEAAIVKGTLGGAVSGFAVGIVIDLAVFGRPRRTQWKFTLGTLLFAVLALAVIAIGLLSLWEIIHLPPTNY